MKARNYILILLLCLSSNLWAGVTPLFLYKYTENVALLPSLVGYNGGSIYLSQQMNYVGFENAPSQTLFGFNTLKGKERLGLGLNVVNQQGFSLNEFSLSVPVAYYLPINSRMKLSFGLSGDYYYRSLNVTDQYVEDLDDTSILNSERGFFDASFSTAFHHPYFTVAASFNHLNSWMNNTQGMQGYFTSFVQADIPLTNEYDRIEVAGTVIYGLDGSFVWNGQAFYEVVEHVILGAGYTSTNSIITSLGLHYNNRWLLGYGFYYNVGSDATYFKNSHELTLKFHLDRQYYEQHRYSRYAIRKGAMLKK
ncbi:MAG: type IX secretion system membrane protein PorP/SprF [Cytophagales bacterium]|nr:type IX secretion system membrane protein PorP/SprF [Cytophagales bacterium]